MKSHSSLLILALLALSGAACRTDRHSPSAFHLPPGGDVERGKLAFVHQHEGCTPRILGNEYDTDE